MMLTERGGFPSYSTVFDLVTSNVGTKVLTISGNVDKADTPATTTPANPTK
jgi:hypothetical protein